MRPEKLAASAVRAVTEADIAFFDDPADAKADQVDGAIGELSAFHETFGYYAQGVSVSTAVLPEGWRDRVIALATPSTAPGRGQCLDPHDCVISKLVAGREKDMSFAAALVREGLINLDTLANRCQPCWCTSERSGATPGAGPGVLQAADAPW